MIVAAPTLTPTTASASVGFAPSSATASPDSPIGRRWPREPRAAHRVACQVRCADGSTGPPRVTNGETVNLSHRGVAVVLGCEVQEGAGVEVLLSSLDGGPAILYGRVAHCRRVMSGTFEIGVAVTDEFRPL